MAKYERAILAALIVVLSGGLYVSGSDATSEMVFGFTFGYFLAIFSREMGVI